MTDTAPRELPLQELDEVIIRFAGDSGDGMQLTGDQFTSISAALGNDLATLPEFPAEIELPKEPWRECRHSKFAYRISLSQPQATLQRC